MNDSANGFERLRRQQRQRKQAQSADETEIESLAKLSPLDYDRSRATAAKKLGVRTAALDRMVEEKRRPRVSDEANRTAAQTRLDEINADNCVVIIGQKTMVLRFEAMPIEAHGVRYVHRVPTFLKFEDFRNFYLNKYTVDDSGAPFAVDKDGKPLRVGHWWLSHPGRITYDGVVFTPNAPKVVDRRLNLWTGFAVTPKPGKWPLTREHIRAVLAAGDEAVDRYIMNWLAYAVQHPEKQAEAALVFLGGEGTGKTLLGVAMCRIFGAQHSCHISSAEEFTGKFNAHLQQCCFLFSDEAYAPQDRKAESVLKDLITGHDIKIEPKGVNRYRVANRLHVMMASNHEWVVPAGAKARRFVVQEIDEIRQQDKGYFGKIFAEMDSGGIEAMFHDLLQRDLTCFHPRDIVRTRALSKQQEHSLDPCDLWMLELLQTGVLEGAAEVAPYEAASNSYEEKVEEETGGGLYGTQKRKRTVKRNGLYDQARRISPKLKTMSDTALGRYLNDFGCENIWPYRGGRSRRGWRFPTLADCRAKWCERFPGTVWRDPNVAAWAFAIDAEPDP